ncbi:MAG: hypothetical protein ACRD1T_03960 [Acidimicrobiia bacterium]
MSSFLFVLLTILSVAFAAGCSGSGSADNETEADGSSSTDTSALPNLDEPLDEWAASAAAVYRTQVESGSEPDHTAVVREIAAATQNLTKSLCESFRDNDALSDPDKASDLEKQVTFAADEALARAIARTPRLLTAIGMDTWGQWPQFVLKEPAPAVDTPVEDLSQGISEFVKAEFIDEDGGLVIPSKRSPDYEAFQSWFYHPSLDNPLLEQTTVTTSSFNGWTSTCSK